MSRYELPGKKLGTTIAVGWDAPLQTFFMQVFRPGRRTASVWKGGSPDDRLPDFEDLRRVIAPYADLPALTASLLVGDQDEDR